SPRPPGIGRGVAVTDRGTGGGEGTTEITLKPDGTAVIGTPIFDQGTGTYATLMQVTAEELDVPYDSISIDVWDSGAVEFDSGIAGSRGTRVNTAACFLAAEEVKKALIGVAARYFGCSEDVLSFADGHVRRTGLEESIPWPDLLAQVGQEVKGRG